jgi:beta-galactosidase
MEFSVKDGCFYSGNEKVFLNSGEIHYFRIKREFWDKHLEAAKEAGLSCVSSYVPWAWHEPEEGSFDFTGTSLPERDLEGWLQRCKAHGLQCILKPGPFILAEWRGAGLPDWLMEQHGNDLKMRSRKGEIVPSDGVNLLHPVYLEKVKHWYDHVMPLIKNYQSSNGGPVIMMQVCNEIGVFAWLAHQADYSQEARGKFINYLKKKFDDIHQINSLWETSYRHFEEIELPPDGKLPYASKADRSRDYEWHCFWRAFYGEYLRLLAGMISERGITLPLYHNLPGWIYGHGYEFPVNITMYDDLYGDRSEIIFGIDHIPEFVSHRNLHDDRIINDIARSMQGNKPLFAAEFQSGSREYHVVTNPREMELFYKASIANGLTGWNYTCFRKGETRSAKAIRVILFTGSIATYTRGR